MATLVAGPDRFSGWRSLLGAVSITGLSAVGSGLLSLTASKLVAVTSGPEAVALLGTVQQLRQTAVAAAGINGQAAIIQGTSALNGTPRREFVRTALLLIALTTLAVMFCLVLMPERIARIAGVPEIAGLLPLLAPSVLFGTIYGFGMALLGGAGAVRRLASVQIMGPAATMLLAYPALKSGAPWWVIGLVTGSALAASAGTILATARTGIHGWFCGEGRWWSNTHLRSLLAVAGSLGASAVFANWVLLSTRARIVRQEGWGMTGQFDAAWAISMNQTGLVLAALQSHFLPTLARAQAGERTLHLTRVLLLSSAISACIILGLAATKPLLLRTLYSGRFLEATQFLRWTLVGDFFKVTSWILSTTILARARAGLFLLADVVSYGTFGLTAWALNTSQGAAEAAAIGFVAMYFAHTLVCGWLLWLREEYRPGKLLLYSWLAALSVVVGGSFVFWEQI